MQTADLITAFLSNEMTAEQERQFLLSVAASDSLRLGLKSHVMVDRIFQKQLAEASVPADVKAKIFTAMAASIGPVAAQTTAQPDAASSSAAPISQGVFRSFMSRFSTGLLAASLAVGGFAAGYLVHSEAGEGRALPTQAISIPSTPRDERPAMSVPAPSSSALDHRAAAAPASAPSAEQRMTSPVAASSRAHGRSSAAARISSSTAAPAEISSPATGAVQAGSPAVTVPATSQPENKTTNGQATPPTAISVKANIHKPSAEDRKKANTSEDQGMP
jgi:hypothetical protein